MNGNLPLWLGSSVCYSRAYRILEDMGRRGHVASDGRNNRRTPPMHVSEDMKALIDALNSGDEEAIKGMLLMRHVYYVK